MLPPATKHAPSAATHTAALHRQAHHVRAADVQKRPVDRTPADRGGLAEITCGGARACTSTGRHDLAGLCSPKVRSCGMHRDRSSVARIALFCPHAARAHHGAYRCACNLREHATCSHLLQETVRLPGRVRVVGVPERRVLAVACMLFGVGRRELPRGYDPLLPALVNIMFILI